MLRLLEGLDFCFNASNEIYVLNDSSHCWLFWCSGFLFNHFFGLCCHREALDGKEPVPVSFRYTVSPLRSKSTHCYRPNMVTVPSDGSNMAANMLGGVFAGKYNKIPCNKRASVVWEARLVQTNMCSDHCNDFRLYGHLKTLHSDFCRWRFPQARRSCRLPSPSTI